MPKIQNTHRLQKIRGRISSGRGDGCISLDIDDERSRLIVCRIEIPSHLVGQILFGGGATVDVQINSGNPNVGKYHEVDHAEVWIPRFYHGIDLVEHQKKVDAILSNLCVDGWEPDREDVSNSHNIIRGKDARRPPDGQSENKGDWFRVARHRYVTKRPKKLSPNPKRTQAI